MDDNVLIKRTQKKNERFADTLTDLSESMDDLLSNLSIQPEVEITRNARFLVLKLMVLITSFEKLRAEVEQAERIIEQANEELPSQLQSSADISLRYLQNVELTVINCIGILKPLKDSINHLNNAEDIDARLHQIVETENLQKKLKEMGKGKL